MSIESVINSCLILDCNKRSVMFAGLFCKTLRADARALQERAVIENAKHPPLLRLRFVGTKFAPV